ncbi:MAG: hypothetical protein M3256_19150 [Actinomycetota bacterium]|nr:hypothetical protein [Actinomycetota bacterium]
MLVLIGVIAVIAGNGGKTKRSATGPGEIFLEPAANAGGDPFTPSVAQPTPTPTVPANAPVTLGPAVPPVPAPTAPTFTASQRGGGGANTITPVSGDTPGLYGGTRNQSTCDPRQMIDYLTHNPAVGRAWAQAEGILPSEIARFIGSLTPVLLRSDTRVTNHGFRGGQPTPHQSVLQAGTAVLVNDKGEPRARCACGNPLLGPKPAPTTPTYTGPQWPGFSTTNISVITQSTTVINIITLIDVTTGNPFGRPAGTAGAGDQPLPTTSAPPTTTPASTGPGATRVMTFEPWTLNAINGEPGPREDLTVTAAGGTCDGGTQADPGRSEAYRCRATDGPAAGTRFNACFIPTPPLSLPGPAVLCSTDPTSNAVSLLSLTQPVPAPNRDDPSAAPWFLVLVGGSHCAHVGSGTDTAVLSYDCTDGSTVTAPDRSKAAWTVQKGTFVNASPVLDPTPIAVAVAYR